MLTTTATVAVLNDIEQLITAALEAETKLSRTVTQDNQAAPAKLLLSDMAAGVTTDSTHMVEAEAGVVAVVA